MSLTDGQLFVTLALLATAVAAVWMIAADYRRKRAARRELDAHVEALPIDEARYQPDQSWEEFYAREGREAPPKPWDFPDTRHLDGVPWHQAPLPPRRHKCWAQTDAWIDLRHIQRCACGATRMAPWPEWMGRNETRDMAERRAAEEKAAREWTDTPIYTATARALADTAAEFRDRAEAGRALVGKGLGWRR